MPGHDPRWLLVGERAGAGDDGRWHYEDVRAALPQVYPATRELFIPQALNLDALRGVSFDKGCYVGQEIIARLHFRGTVKRRMRLLTGDSGIGAAVPGGAVRRGTESIGKIVDAAEWSGRGALLAVCSVDAPADELTLEDGTALGPAPLPYALPDG
jgi:folate-binding protein YgfZ